MKYLRANWRLSITAALTALIGLLTLSSTLYSLVHLRRARLVLADAHLSVIAGISLIYLATVLKRGKVNAWRVSIIVSALVLGRNLQHFVFDDELSRHYLWLVLTNLLLPVVLLATLIVWHRYFTVRSSVLTFRIALKRAILILLIAFLYGVIGFQLFDKRDFHQEIAPLTAAHYTLDQFGLTTNNQPTTYTRRAVFFVDSLASVSVVALGYVALAFFAPARFRLSHHQKDYLDATEIVHKFSKTSEDFFKLWPRDKAYFFNHERDKLIAYKVTQGVALSVGDPLGSSRKSSEFLQSFLELCRTNDWRPGFIHTDASNIRFFKKHGLEAQKLGEEAIVDIENFAGSVARNKYFRNINNRFSKAGYSFEMLAPPHAEATVRRLQEISNDWLAVPGRSERGFMMGYFTADYIQKCSIAILKDSEDNIQAFLSQVPTITPTEANYDFLRHAAGSPSNINDFLMINFINYLAAAGYKKLNMGLCPLSGLDEPDSDAKTLVDNILRFAYTNGGRFYSFEGLKRFKSKYEPDWQPRYIIYSGGVAGFGRTLSALLKAMTVK